MPSGKRPVARYGPITYWNDPMVGWTGRKRIFVFRQSLHKRGRPYEAVPGLQEWYPTMDEAKAAVREWETANG